MAPFLAFLEEQGITTPEAITPHLVRTFIVGLQRRGLGDKTVHNYATVVRAFLNFCAQEGIIPETPCAR